MCLYTSKSRTEAFREAHKGEEYITCYKVLSQYTFGLYSPFYSYEWMIGVNVAVMHETFETAMTTLHSDSSYYRFERGIHVFLDIVSADLYSKCLGAFPGHLDIVVSVQCKMKKLLAVGNDIAYNTDNRAVFSEVELSEEQYNKALDREGGKVMESSEDQSPCCL